MDLGGVPPFGARRLATSSLLLLLPLPLSLLSSTAAGEEFPVGRTSAVVGQSYGVPVPKAVGPLKPGPQSCSVVAEAIVYFKNLELLGLRELDGETFFGSMMPVALRYAAAPNTHIDAGALVGRDFGDDKPLNRQAPILRIWYQPVSDVHVIAGTLVSSHWIHDAIGDDVNVLRSVVEEGIQIRIDKAWLKHDSFINWHVREGPVRAEHFEVATATQLRLHDDLIRLEAQYKWAHIGGQISASPELVHNHTMLAGISLGDQAVTAKAMAVRARVGYRRFLSDDDARGRARLYGGGWQAWGRVDLDIGAHTFLRAFASKFIGDNFVAMRGDPLYRFARYRQLGLTALCPVDGGLQIEATYVQQWAGGARNYSYFVYFTWGIRAALTPASREEGFSAAGSTAPMPVN